MTALLTAIVLLALGSANQNEAPPVQLPQPSGPYAIGRVGYDWTDQHRADEFAAQVPNSHRELMVYVWYPAKKRAAQDKAADYLPQAKLIQGNVSPDGLESEWGNSWRTVFSGQVRTNACDNAPIAGSHEHFPLLVFSSGLGVPVTAYTAMFQEIVSHGYIVAAIEPMYESTIAFPDGRIVHSVAAASISRRPRPGESRKQLLDRARAEDVPVLDRRSADIRFVIDQFLALHVGPLVGRVDFGQIAAWGHSIGGRSAARACQLDRRIKACLNADGGGLDGPVAVYPGAAMPVQPFMLMGGPAPPPPTDAILALYKISREDWHKERDARDAAYEQQFRSLTGGSYFVTFAMPGMGHMSLSDQPLLDAGNAAEFRLAAQNLSIFEGYTLAFFDKYLKHHKGTLLDSVQKPPAGVEVKEYAR